MSEIRIDPLTGDYIIVNDQRMNRPVIVSDNNTSKECPFCPESTKRHPGLPLEYEALAVTNLYSSLELNPDLKKLKNEGSKKETLFISKPNIGKCEVLLYSSDHDLEFYDQSKELTLKIMKLWKDRFVELQEISLIKYIYIFENRGSGAGVTILHPHGQLYALSFIPPIVKRQLKNTNKYFQEHDSCLMCDIIQKERNENQRIILENNYFIAFVPYYAKMLYEVHIAPLEHHESIIDMNMDELKAFGSIIQEVRRKYDSLFSSKKASFMMMLFNEPVNTNKKYNFHFYLQFVCLDKDEKNFKYRASVETGLQVWTNDVSPEKIAEEFKKKI